MDCSKQLILKDVFGDPVLDRKGNPKYYREKGTTIYTEKCPHYQGCLKELGLPKDHKISIWREDMATQKEIAAGLYHPQDRPAPKRIWRLVKRFANN